MSKARINYKNLFIITFLQLLIPDIYKLYKKKKIQLAKLNT